VYFEPMLYNTFIPNKKAVQFQNKIAHIVWNTGNFVLKLHYSSSTFYVKKLLSNFFLKLIESKLVIFQI
jgi:hypothetical protein